MRALLLAFVVLLTGSGCLEELKPAPVVPDAVHFLAPADGAGWAEPIVRVEGEARLAAGINWMEAVVNGSPRVLPPPPGGATASFSFDAPLRAGANLIEVVAHGKKAGESIRGVVHVNGAYEYVRILDFHASPAHHGPDEPVTLRWHVQGAAPLLVELAGHGPVEPVGSLVVQPREDRIYRLAASNAGSGASAEVVTTVLPRMVKEIPVVGAGVRSYLRLDDAPERDWRWSATGGSMNDYESGSGASWTAPLAAGSVEISAVDVVRPERRLARRIEVVDPPLPIEPLRAIGGQPGDRGLIADNAEGDRLHLQHEVGLLWRAAEERWDLLRFDFSPEGILTASGRRFLVHGGSYAPVQLVLIDLAGPAPTLLPLELPYLVAATPMPLVQLAGETIYLASGHPNQPNARVHTFTLSEGIWRETPALPGGMRTAAMVVGDGGSLVVRAELDDAAALFRLDPATFGWDRLSAEVGDARLLGLADGSVWLLGTDLRRLAEDGSAVLFAANVPERTRYVGLVVHQNSLVTVGDGTLLRAEDGSGFQPWLELPRRDVDAGADRLLQTSSGRIFLLGRGQLLELVGESWVPLATAGLPAREITALSVAPDGGLVIALAARYQNGGVYLRAPGAEDVAQLLEPATEGDGEPGPMTRFAWRGDALAFADDEMIFASNPLGSEPVRIDTDEGLPAGGLAGLGVAADGSWLACKRAGVFTLAPGAGWSQLAALDGLVQCTVDDAGHVWASAGGTIHRLQAGGIDWEALPPLPAGAYGSPTIAIDAEGTPWVANDGVYRLALPGWEAIGSGGCATLAERVLPLRPDLVLCDAYGGLQWLDPASGAWAHFTPLSRSFHAAAVTLDPDGRLYLGTEGFGLFETRVRPAD